MNFETVYTNVQENIKHYKRLNNYTWDDIRSILKRNKSVVRMSYIKKLSYGQQKTIDMEKLCEIAQLFGANLIEFIRINERMNIEIEEGASWLEEV